VFWGSTQSWYFPPISAAASNRSVTNFNSISSDRESTDKLLFRRANLAAEQETPISQSTQMLSSLG